MASNLQEEIERRLHRYRDELSQTFYERGYHVSSFQDRVYHTNDDYLAGAQAAQELMQEREACLVAALRKIEDVNSRETHCYRDWELRLIARKALAELGLAEEGEK